MSDWQLGKDDFGVENTIKRYDIALQDALALLKITGKIGYQIDEIYLVGMGDLTKTAQNFSTTANHTMFLSNLMEQYSLAKAMMYKL